MGGKNPKKFCSNHFPLYNKLKINKLQLQNILQPSANAKKNAVKQQSFAVNLYRFAVNLYRFAVKCSNISKYIFNINNYKSIIYTYIICLLQNLLQKKCQNKRVCMCVYNRKMQQQKKYADFHKPAYRTEKEL